MVLRRLHYNKHSDLFYVETWFDWIFLVDIYDFDELQITS